MIKNYYYSTLRRQIRKITKNHKIIKSQMKRIRSEDLSIEYIYKLIKENNLDISKLDNKEVVKRIFILGDIDKLEEKNLQNIAKEGIISGIKNQEEEIKENKNEYNNQNKGVVVEDKCKIKSFWYQISRAKK